MESKLDKLVYVPGVCAGHPDHPELLWVFRRDHKQRLHFDSVEIDFPEPGTISEGTLHKFDVNMKGYKGCPYCEAKLYFFCKRCRSLSCFSWDQITAAHHWTCHSCQSVYRMKPKTTPFRVEAQVNASESKSANPETSADVSKTQSFQAPQSGNKTQQRTQMWHPKIK